MVIVFTESAAKRGYTKADALHVLEHAEYRKDKFDVSRTGLPDPTIWIGPACSGERLEVFTCITSNPDRLIIFHMMPVREKFLRLMWGDTE